MGRGFKLTVRHAGRVEQTRHETLVTALDALESRMESLGQSARKPAVDLRVRRIEPVAQVAARGEIAGPGRGRDAIRAGVDLRGDGSAEAYLGRIRRTLVVQHAGESPYDALRRVLGDQSASSGP